MTAAAKNVITLIRLQACDQYGNYLVTPSFASLVDAISISSGNGATATGTVVDSGVAGSATLQFVGTALGTVQVQVRIKGAQVKGSPMSIEIKSRLVPYLANTLVWGSMVAGAQSLLLRR